MNTIYPEKYRHCVILFLLSFLVTSICFGIIILVEYIITKKAFTPNMFDINVISVLLTICHYLITKYKNKKRKVCFNINLSFNIPIKSILAILGIIFFFYLGRSLIYNQFNQFQKTSVDISFILSSISIGPITEEIIFRGTYLKGLLNRHSIVKSILFTSVFFALLHIFNYNTLFGCISAVTNALIIGIFLGWLFYKTGSVGLTIVVHALFNAFAYLINPIIIHLNPFLSGNNILVIVIILSSFFIVFYFVKYLSNHMNL